MTDQTHYPTEHTSPDYLRFCDHYGYEVGSAESLRDYAEYVENREILRGLAWT